MLPRREILIHRIRLDHGTFRMTKTYLLATILLLSVVAGCVLPQEPRVAETRQTPLNLLIVVDGLRPDYITPEIMPNLYALGKRGVFGDMHSAAFPSVTRVNSATISTGSYPERHGIMHNTMLVEALEDEAFSTGSADNLRRLAKHNGGQLLHADTLGKLLGQAGMRLFVTGTGGSGTSLLQNPAAGAGMGIWTARGFFVPADARGEAIAAVGELPKGRSARTAWAFDAYLQKVLSDDPPEVGVMWINEPDSVAHRYGIGAAKTLKAVANVDTQLGRIVAAFEKHGLTNRVNIFVTSDHGYSTYAGGFRPGKTLRENGIDDNAFSLVKNMVFLERDDPSLLARVVRAFQCDPEAGNVYTRPLRPGSSKGIVPGTLSTAVIQWNHARAADVIVSPDWTGALNKFGFPGASTSGIASPAGHGSDSPYDLQIRLVAAGPGIKTGVRSSVPTGNVDLAPTILHLLGIEPPPQMDGRVLHELLRGGDPATSIKIHERTHRAAVTLDGGFRYEAEFDTLRVGSTVYLREARTSRSDVKAADACDSL